ncbi:uncharacterized protein CIMG_12908 [Coccidioides immitis RS]|uniref:Uncharacterized protein n=1 Tax=Coccidioides immitis (strain RS) TaxID=246410 RepID=J3KG69_COCIM|nr:uncharacterized protein CIMG_12908 [Coccidioides immitis RS]EAS34708.3 hypothetical protein CIMG_12908 [Coccidioides immitis RS]
MNVSGLKVKLYRMFLNVYKLLNDLVKLDFRLVNIKNINLKCIHDLTNKISDVDRDNEDDRDNETDRNNRDDRNNKDDKDNKKSNSHVLENTEHKKTRK